MYVLGLGVDYNPQAVQRVDTGEHTFTVQELFGDYGKA